jgi:MFS family permease
MNAIKKLLAPYKGLPKEVYVIFISRIVNAMGCFVMPLLTIILTEKIGLSKEATGLYITITGFLFVPTSAIGGKLADTIGRKKIIVIFNFLAAVLYIICGFMPPTVNMVYVLMAASACMSFAGPAHDSLIADLTTPENRTSAYALTYMGWNIGFAVGPAIGGMLYKKNLLSFLFIGDAVTALLSLSLIALFIKETIYKTKEEITDKNRKLEKREEGSVFSVLLKRPILIYFALICFGYNFTYSQWGFMLPMHSVENFGKAGAQYYGLMASTNGMVVMFFTPLIVKLTEKVNIIRKMVCGGILYAVGFGMLGFLNSLPFFFVSVFIFTLGEIVMSIATTPFIANHTPASHRGRMNAVIPMILGAGYTLGPMSMGKILSYISIETGWIALGLFTLVTSGFMYMLEKYDDRKNREKVEEAIEIG